MALTDKDLIDAIMGTKSKELSETEKSALEFLDGTPKKKKTAKELEEERKEAEKSLRDSLTELQILLTDITGGRLPRSGINHVITRYPED